MTPVDIGPPPPGFDPKVRAIVGETLADYMFKRSAALAVMDEDLKTPRDEGSGFAFQIAGRFFIGTVAHIARNRDDFTIFINSKTEPTDLALRTVDHGTRGHEVPFNPEDIGWIELTAAAAKVSGLTFMGLDDVLVDTSKLADGFIHLMGSPGEHTEVHEYRGKPLRKRMALPFFTNVRGPGPSDFYDASADIYVGWDSEHFRDAPGGHAVVKTPDARGMSGGAIWASPSLEQGKLWVPTPKLIGIIRSAKPGEWIRGTQIHRWLRLVAHDIPELQGVIELALGR